MATVTKNFRIKSGLIVEGTTGTINGQNILTETGGDSYILNLVGGATLVKSVDTGVFNVDGAGNLTVNANTFDSYGSASAAQTAAEATASADATSKANAAQLAAETTAALDATSKANAAQAAAEATAALDATSKANAAQAAAEQHADNAVAALVGSAPAVLDTIQELATALENNPDIIADLENVAAGKQDTLTAGSNIDITGSTISVTGLDSADISDFTGAARAAILPGVGVNLNTATGYIDANLGLGLETDGSNNIQIDRGTVDGWYDASGAAATAETNAIAHADGLAGNYDAAGSAADAQTNAENFASGLVGNLLDATTPFESLNLNDVAKQVAARSTSLGSVPVTAYQFNKGSFKSGKFLVKIDNGTHNELSEILVTLDSADNIAITEYAIVGTNGSRGTITADINNSHCRIIVTPVNDSTITISGTIFNA